MSLCNARVESQTLELLGQFWPWKVPKMAPIILPLYFPCPCTMQKL